MKDEIFILLSLGLSRSHWFEDYRIDPLGKKYLTGRYSRNPGFFESWLLFDTGYCATYLVGMNCMVVPMSALNTTALRIGYVVLQH